MSKKFERIFDKLESIDKRLDSVDVTLGKQSIILDEHVKRTNLLEKKMEPIEKHVVIVGGLMKYVGFAISGGVLVELIKLIAHK